MQVIHTRADRELRPGVWHPLRVEVRGGNTTTVYCGTRSILQSVSGARRAPSVSLIAIEACNRYLWT